MTDELSRFTWVAAPALAPANDLITGSTVGPFIDTGYDIPFALRGRLYISLDTLREMARVAGLFEEEKQLGELMHEASEYTRGYTDCLKENLSGELRDIHDRLGLVADWLGGVADAAVETKPEAAQPVLVGAPTIEPEPDAGSKPSTPRPARARRQSNGARSVERPADVSSGAGDGNPFRV